MISIQGLTRRYGSTVALDDVSLEIQSGEVVGLLGHNGAGKTTMMKILTGYLAPSAGRVTVEGLDVVADREGVQARVGYLPESAPLYTEMLVQDYLLMMAALRGVEPGRREAAAVDAARATGLMDRLVQPIGTLSKGYRQRVGLAQAILHRPSVLILDEPTNGLDPTQIRGIRQLVRRLSEGSTVLLSTHILQEIEAVCDRVLVLVGGRLVADEPLAALTASEAVEVSLAEGSSGVAEGLARLGQPTRLGPDPRLPGFERWRVACESPASASPAIAGLAAAEGWKLGSVGPAQRSLEQVFKELQEREAAREVVA